jgi:hypothetical protein
MVAPSLTSRGPELSRQDGKADIDQSRCGLLPEAR